MKHTVHYPITIYYDASCPICAGEMHTLKAADTDNKITLVDCSAPGFDDQPFARDNVTVKSMLNLIHARDARGYWFKGVDVFAIAYEAAGFYALAALWRHSRLRPLWDRAYPWIARNRYALSKFWLPNLLTGALRLLSGRAKRRTAQATVAAIQGCGENQCSRGRP